MQALKESFKDEQEYSKQQIHSLNVKKQKLKERIDTLYLDKLDGKISEDFGKNECKRTVELRRKNRNYDYFKM